MHKPFHTHLTSLFIAIALISFNFAPSFAIQKNSENTLPPSPFKDSKQVGMIVSLKGISIIKRSDGTKITARTKVPIYEGDRIETGLGAFAQIEFIDQSKVSIRGSSDFTIKNYVYKSIKDVQYTAKMDNGLISFMSGNIGRIAPQEFTIETAMATIGIRGTSGEILTADGTIPGRPQTLEVMKKGGIGISLTLAAFPKTETLPPTPPKTLIIVESGKGFVIKERKIEQVTFNISPGEKYISQEDSRIEKKQIEKKEHASEEKKPLASRKSTEIEKDRSPSKENKSFSKILKNNRKIKEPFSVKDIEDSSTLETVFEKTPAINVDLEDFPTELEYSIPNTKTKTDHDRSNYVQRNEYTASYAKDTFGEINKQTSSLKTYIGTIKGVAISKNDNVTLLTDISLSLEFDAAHKQISGTIKETDNEPKHTFNILSQKNSFISKDDFSSSLELVFPTDHAASLGNGFSSQTINDSESLFQSKNGLETFSFTNWGIWQVQGNTKIAFGYFAAGKNNTPYVNLPSIISRNPSITYSGSSIATIYDSSNPEGFVDTGSATLLVDFSNGGVSGNISLNSGPSIELLNSSISQTENGLPFSGVTKLNGTQTNNGFSGRFYGNSAQESSGTFHAQDSVQKITGAFGVKQN